MNLRRAHVVSLGAMAVLVACIHLGCDGNPNGQPAARQDITGAQLQAMMADGDPLVLIDVRTAEEYATGHIPGALNHPVGDIGTWAATLTPSARTCCVCQSGGRSATAADTLVGQGFTNVYNLLGGMSSWTGATE